MWICILCKAFFRHRLLSAVAAQLRRYAGMSIYAFDKGMSMYPLAAGIRAATKGKSGLHFTVAADDDRLAFCPLQFLETKADRAWAMEWIDTILALNGVDTTPGQRNEIGHAIMSMHASGARTFSEFSVTIQDEAIREAIKQYGVDQAVVSPAAISITAMAAGRSRSNCSGLDEAD